MLKMIKLTIIKNKNILKNMFGQLPFVLFYVIKYNSNTNISTYVHNTIA